MVLQRRRSVGRGALHWGFAVVAILALTAASIAFGLRVTPLQSVSALGQTVAVGTANPTLSLSGPGVLELFGQSLPTIVQFTGPVRPRLVLTKVTINQQVSSFLAPRSRAPAGRDLGRELASGWTRYFAWEVLFVGLCALVLSVGYLGLRRRSWRRALLSVGLSLLVVEGVNLGWIMLTAYDAPRILAGVHSLSALVGQEEPRPIAPSPGPALSGIQAVVLGDSTASGLGLAPLEHPTPLDQACHRSADAYGLAIGTVNGWNVENLACSGATIPAGILGPQPLGSLSAPPQLAEAKRIVGLKAILVSVGADDVHWDAIVQLCAVAKHCNDAASTAYFQSQLNAFTTQYYQLLAQLVALPGHPQVLVNQYYDPFNPASHCLDHVGLTASKQHTLVDWLNALNAVLAQGARESGFQSVAPDFSGHALCSSQPYVQGINDPAPFHPTTSGELALALPDERALEKGG